MYYPSFAVPSHGFSEDQYKTIRTLFQGLAIPYHIVVLSDAYGGQWAYFLPEGNTKIPHALIKKGWTIYAKDFCRLSYGEVKDAIQSIPPQFDYDEQDIFNAHDALFDGSV